MAFLKKDDHDDMKSRVFKRFNCKDDHDDMKSRVFKRFNCNDKDQSTHKGFLSLLPRVSGEICLR